VANRIVEITPDGIIDVMMGFDDYLASREMDLDASRYVEPQAA